jgi:hypothetical protein
VKGMVREMHVLRRRGTADTGPAQIPHANRRHAWQALLERLESRPRRGRAGGLQLCDAHRLVNPRHLFYERPCVPAARFLITTAARP